MGKGFNNYMCKKFFHPASRDNLKRVWMAEQKAESYKKKQEELRVQYEKEQDLYTNKAMLSKESKDKLSVNFMYEPPPGTKKEREREDDEPEYKFEWQRKFNAPREDYCKGDSEIRDQPFGIQVRNVRCIKCHKWGHINTDKECPMYNQSSSTDQASSSMDPMLLVQQMREDGLAMKQSALGLHLAATEHMHESDDDHGRLKDSEVELLKSLSKKQKQKLLRKFIQLEKSAKKEKKLKKKKKSKKGNKKRRGNSSDDGKGKHKSKKHEKEITRKCEDSSSSDSDSDTGTGESDYPTNKKKRHQSRLDGQEREEFKNMKIKCEMTSSSSDSDSLANGNVREKYTKLYKNQEKNKRSKEMRRARSSSSSSSDSGRKFKSGHIHEMKRNGEIITSKNFGTKEKLHNGESIQTKHNKEYRNNFNSCDEFRKRDSNDKSKDKYHRKSSSESSDGRSHRKRHSSSSSFDEKPKNKVSRIESDYKEHKKDRSEKQAKNSERSKNSIHR